MWGWGGRSTTSARRHTRHAPSTRHATYAFVVFSIAATVTESDVLASLKIKEFACVFKSDANSLVRPMALHETLRDLPLHSVADFAVAALLHTRYNNNHNNSPPQLTTKTCVTVLLLFSPSAIKRCPTSVNLVPSCNASRQTHTRRQHPTSCHIHTSALHAFVHNATPSPPHMPLLTK